MDAPSISPLAALGGALIGGLTSFAASWVTQQSQSRAQQLAHKLTRREQLYKDFVEEASKLYADSLVHETPDISQLIRLYAMNQHDTCCLTIDNCSKCRKGCSNDR